MSIEDSCEDKPHPLLLPSETLTYAQQLMTFFSRLCYALCAPLECVHNILYFLHWSLWAQVMHPLVQQRCAQGKVHTAHCTLNTVHCTLYNVSKCAHITEHTGHCAEQKLDTKVLLLMHSAGPKV